MQMIGRHFGHIRVTEVVGQGGMGDVYGGYDEKLERKVALKVLNDDQRLDAEARERLLREARALSKLDHPNICRIHDYIETRDVDLLVLEYIDGRTLHDAIQEGLPHQERLSIAIAIADVMAQAHRAGIVHRDLKPENVMLTTTGEVKVLDFGLARWLHRKTKSSDRHVAIRPSGNVRAVGEITDTAPLAFDAGIGSRRDFLATAVGITLGTPLFMSPEQARGETLTPASDMFSFGLLLQSLFTGEDPHPMNLTAREVILRVARGETQPVKGAPGDVTALINRLKQFAPADRPTAVEAADRLRFLDAKPQRIARRAIVAAIAFFALLGAWRYTVDLTRERTIAVEQRAEAQKRRAQAEDLIEFMLSDLRNKLQTVGRLDILDDVAERALSYAGSLQPELMSVAELARNGKALNQLGEVRVGQGKTSEALVLFRKSLQFAEAAVKRNPRDPQAQMVFGATHFWIGNTLRLQGNTSEALRHMQAYVRAGDALVSIDPMKREHQLERAYGHSGVASIMEGENRLRDALTHYVVSMEIKANLARLNPGDIDAKAELARAHNKMGNVLYLLGDLRRARESFEQELAACRELVKREPNNKEWATRQAISLAYLALVLNATGRGAEAYALWQEELAIERDLMARDPENVLWRRGVAVTMRRLASVLASTGDTKAALLLFRDARTTLKEAIQQAPDRASWPVDLASLEIDYADALADGNQLRAAEDMLLQVQQRLAAMKPSDRVRHETARCMFTLGEINKTVAPDEALALWMRAEQEVEPLVPSFTETSRLDLWLRILVRRNRRNEAAEVQEKLRKSGYASPSLGAFCRESGC
jgi:eukaryotic-like serine/threonine-protein kinase